MARNTKPEYINKLLKTTTENGYKFDVANYLYNPAYSYDYPAFMKKIGETETSDTYRRVYYMKHYDGTGEYIAETFEREKSAGRWAVIKTLEENTLESSNRYNLNKLISFC